MSFCRGLSTSHKTGAGRALTGAEVWKWCPHCVWTGTGLMMSPLFVECRPEVVWGPIWKQSVLLPLLQNKSGGPVRVALMWTEFVVLWQLIWEDTVNGSFRICPTCLQTRRFRIRCAGREQKRVLLNRLTQSKTIVLSSALPDLLLRLNSQQRQSFATADDANSVAYYPREIPQLNVEMSIML